MGYSMGKPSNRMILSNKIGAERDHVAGGIRFFDQNRNGKSCKNGGFTGNIIDEVSITRGYNLGDLLREKKQETVDGPAKSDKPPISDG